MMRRLPRLSLCLAVVALSAALLAVQPAVAGAQEHCQPENGATHAVDPPTLVDHKVRAHSQVKFSCIPPDLDHFTLAIMIKEYQAFGIWTEKASDRIDFRGTSQSITLDWNCKGEGSQLYQVVSSISWWYRSPGSRPRPGALYAKESAQRRFSC